MTTDELISSFGSVFNLLWSNEMLGMPILFWFVLIGVFSIVGAFIKGGKEK